MNPSSTGWIHKFINDFTNSTLLDNYKNPEVFYEELKKTGFIYGVSVSTVLEEPISDLLLTKEEFTKVNLFHSLWYTFYSERPNQAHNNALKTIISFYESIGRGKRNFFQKLNFSTTASENLERIISARLQESNTTLKKETTLLLTYALLYVDVLAFTYYLKNPEQLKPNLERFEKTLLEYTALALQSKKVKNKYDKLIIDMVNDSSGFFNAQHQIPAEDYSLLEKRFILDICSLAVWDDRILDESELIFLKELATKLGISHAYLADSLDRLMDFSVRNEKKIQLFEYSHPVKQFYKQNTKMVNLLILRNRKRLLTELNESGELLSLLGQSAHRDLTSEEKTKVKEQLLDIFKTIPSLTIFMLPGGAILLPLVVKLIPKLLPSAFQENRVDQSKK